MKKGTQVERVCKDIMPRQTRTVHYVCQHLQMRLNPCCSNVDTTSPTHPHTYIQHAWRTDGVYSFGFAQTCGCLWLKLGCRLLVSQICRCHMYRQHLNTNIFSHTHTLAEWHMMFRAPNSYCFVFYWTHTAGGNLQLLLTRLRSWHISIPIWFSSDSSQQTSELLNTRIYISIDGLLRHPFFWIILDKKRIYWPVCL